MERFFDYCLVPENGVGVDFSHDVAWDLFKYVSSGGRFYAVDVGAEAIGALCMGATLGIVSCFKLGDSLRRKWSEKDLREMGLFPPAEAFENEALGKVKIG